MGVSISKKGVTLAEVLVASLISVLVVGSSLMAILNYNRMIKNNAYRAEALNILKFKMETNNRSPISFFTENATKWPLNSISFDDKSNEVITSHAIENVEKKFFINYGANMVKLGTTIEPGALEYTIRVRWIDANRQAASLELSSRQYLR